MRRSTIPVGAVVVSSLIFLLALFAAMPALAQDEQIGQEGAVWNLGELARGAYPSTITAVNQSCPGAHDFHISLQGEAAEFLTVVGPSILTGIPPGGSKTSDVVVDVRTIAPGPHNQGSIFIKCVDCPVTCTQDYSILSINMTVLGDAVASDVAAAGPQSTWQIIDLTLLDPTLPPGGSSSGSGAQGPDSGLRWINPNALAATTLAPDAVDSGMAELSFSGTGRAAGEIFTLTITRLAETPFEMGFDLGTLVVPDDPRYSTMIVADYGAVALLDEITEVTISGFSLDPTLELPPANGAASSWTVAGPPSSGPFVDAVTVINTAYTLAGTFDDPSGEYFRAVTQRTIWNVSAPDTFGKDRLLSDIETQIEVSGAADEIEEEPDELAEAIWNDLSSVINEGKIR